MATLNPQHNRAATPEERAELNIPATCKADTYGGRCTVHDLPVYMPPAGWTEPDNRGHVQFTLHHTDGHTMHEKAPEREGFECYFLACTPAYTRWTYRPTDTPVQQARLAVIDLQRTLANLDIALNYLRNSSPLSQDLFAKNEQTIAHVVNAKNNVADMQAELLARLPDDVREQTVRGSRIGAEHLRSRS